MFRHTTSVVLAAVLVALMLIAGPLAAQRETKEQHDARMAWWREARFGLFLHWGLYAVPAGTWNGKTNYGEWIRNNAQIPLGVYDKFVGQFNPVKFDADAWVRMAKAAGMKYIVITSKHHDGFCLFDSKKTDFDVMSTPFRRDILKALSEACRRQGMTLCFYYSIMDWHHPDYLPRRAWEKDRPTAKANFDRYVQYMKDELKELLTNYGPIGVLWFDGEWESTWNERYGRELYDYVRSLQPGIIINNRVGASRSGMAGFSEGGQSAGDFGTPEQQIPPTGVPGVDWETCMTMNNNWGYNSHDQNWKSAKTLVRMLADIASKGGNFLLNIGPTAEGVFPPESVDRLREIGTWMDGNGESIRATQASPFKGLAWGRCTEKAIPGGTRLYFHVFDWPADGMLVVPGLLNEAKKAYLLPDAKQGALSVSRNDDALVLKVPRIAPNPVDSVVVLEVSGRPDVSDPPEIASDSEIFTDTLDLTLSSSRDNVEIRYTLDGSVPSASSKLARGPVRLKDTAVVSARCFRKGKAVSGTAQAAFTKVAPRPAEKGITTRPGLAVAYYEGEWDVLPDFSRLRALDKGVQGAFDLSKKKRQERYGIEFTGFIRVPRDGIYVFTTESDDGSRLYIGGNLVVDNDGLHGMTTKRGVIALAAGFHPIRVQVFNKTGNDGLVVTWQGSGLNRETVPAGALFHKP